MPKTKKAVKAATPKKAKAVKPKAAKAAKPKMAKAAKPKAKKAAKPKVAKAAKPKATKVPKAAVEQTAEVLSSEVVFEGPLFRVLRDRLIEPGGSEEVRDIVRHNGSVVILAIDNAKNKKNPWVVIERQYRHAAGRFLWELPAGKLEYFASPGFLGESMKVFIAEGLVAGEAHPEDDERIEFRLVKLSQVVKLIEKGAILDGKTLTSVLLFAHKMAGKHGK